MAQKARPMSEEEADALDQLGQAHEEGRVLPAPEMVLFTGETALKVRELADMTKLPPQEVIGVALQQFYDRVHQRAKEEREAAATRGKADDRQIGGDASQGSPEPDDRDPFRPW